MRIVDRKAHGGYVIAPYVVPPASQITEPLPTPYWMTERAVVEAVTNAEVEAWLAEHAETPDDILGAELDAVLALGELHGDGELAKRIRRVVKLAEVGYLGAAQVLGGIREVWDATEHVSPSPTWFDRTLAYAIAAEHVTPVQPEPNQTGQLGALMGRDFPELDWVVPGIIPEGVTLLTAAPKIGKSWMTLDLAMASATGGLAFGVVSVGAKRPVLYVDLESGERRLQSRIRTQAHDWTGAERFSYHMDAATAGEVIRGFFEQHRGDRPLVVLDMLAGILGPKPANMTPYMHDRSILDPLHAIVSGDPGAALIIVHHTRKTESADPMDLISGTNGFSGAVDTPAILTRPDRGQPLATLFVMGRDMDGDIEFQVELSKRARWELVGGSPKAAAQNAAMASEKARVAKLGSEKQAILTLVNSYAPNDVTTKDIEAAYRGGQPDRVAVNLSELAKVGHIMRPSRGVYRAKGADGLLGSDAVPF